jgi:hypothetical protein
VPSDYLPSEPAKFKKRRKKEKGGNTRKTAELEKMFQEDDEATVEQHQVCFRFLFYFPALLFVQSLCSRKEAVFPLSTRAQFTWFPLKRIEQIN